MGHPQGCRCRETGKLVHPKKNTFAATSFPPANHCIQYYETAANLGDTDAMNEAAWCYLEGFGCKKDKVRTFHKQRRHPIIFPGNTEKNESTMHVLLPSMGGLARVSYANLLNSKLLQCRSNAVRLPPPTPRHNHNIHGCHRQKLMSGNSSQQLDTTGWPRTTETRR